MPAGLLVDEPGVARPYEHVEEAKHLVGKGENEKRTRHRVVNSGKCVFVFVKTALSRKNSKLFCSESHDQEIKLLSR